MKFSRATADVEVNGKNQVCAFILVNVSGTTALLPIITCLRSDFFLFPDTRPKPGDLREESLEAFGDSRSGLALRRSQLQAIY
ncbi:hypothetical protein OJAV_G00122910 [Oryzias javanicus]|uniref:Uncharacterized protein n=1 Tax=Oryzias javanicus TaxID=123683 RepID=A0A437CVD1_ORYJA|nr:hypothetical protein OJAV_G00122910 [Oryzias javanicus]